VKQEDPFLKIKETPEVPTSLSTDSEKQEEIKLNWGASTASENSIVESTEEPTIITRVVLDDTAEKTMSLEERETKQKLSPEEQQKRSQERLSRIQQYTQRLKKADGIQEFENEPAYVRRNIQLDESIPSQSDNSSRFSISKDENGTSLNSNNSFLHDNVD
jgi:cell division protein FtsZ